MNTFHTILTESGLRSIKRLSYLHTSISANPSQIGSFLASEYARADFITNFSSYVENLERFLTFSAKNFSEPNRRPGNKHIAHEIIDLTISVLHHSEFDLADTDTLLKLVITALKYGLPYQPSSLKTVATKLAEKADLLERIVSSTDGAGTISGLFQVHFVNAVPSICDIWAQKLIGLCSACTRSPTCHGIEFEVGEWYTLTDAIEDLEDEYPNLPLGPVAGHSSLPEHVVLAIKELQLKFPQASCKADLLLTQIRDTYIPGLVCTILSTYPCHLCHEHAQNPKSRLPRSLNHGTYTDSPSIMVQDTLFGGPIGLWKILSPDQAIKDIRMQQVAGK